MEYDFYVYMTALSRIFTNACSQAHHLLDFCGSPEKVFRLTEDELSSLLGPFNPAIARLLNPSVLDWAVKEVDWAVSHGVAIITEKDSSYPYRLAECPDSPIVLMRRGNLDLNQKRVLAVVGTRKASFYGRDYCRKILESLASNGINPLVVSGLALGIDGAAHIAALDLGLKTVAVLPCGLNSVYPPRHYELSEKIVESGALVSDFFTDTSTLAYTFVRRNRIIAGMSDATLLVESYRKGGGLITASLANSYSREVFAVPGRNTDSSFEGCNRLIAEEKARIVESPDAIERSMGWGNPRRTQHSAERLPDLGREASLVVESLRRHSPQSAEELMLSTRLSLQSVSTALLELEIDAKIVRDAAGKYDLSC